MNKSFPVVIFLILVLAIPVIWSSDMFNAASVKALFQPTQVKNMEGELGTEGKELTETSDIQAERETVKEQKEPSATLEILHRQNIPMVSLKNLSEQMESSIQIELQEGTVPHSMY